MERYFRNILIMSALLTAGILIHEWIFDPHGHDSVSNTFVRTVLSTVVFSAMYFNIFVLVMLGTYKVVTSIFNLFIPRKTEWLNF